MDMKKRVSPAKKAVSFGGIDQAPKVKRHVASSVVKKSNVTFGGIDSPSVQRHLKKGK